MQAPSSGEQRIVVLTEDQWRLLVRLVNAAPITGELAAMVVSIQQALAAARPPAGKPEDAPQG